MNERLQTAIKFSESGRYNESYEQMLELVKEHPQDPEILYHCASSCDRLGKEAEAVPYYERAIELGLTGKDLEGAYLGLGSTYRTLGNYSKSKSVFEEGMIRFPENQVLKVFYSMTLYNLDEHDKAMEMLLTCLIDTTSDSDILDYQKAIRFYADKLKQIWD